MAKNDRTVSKRPDGQWANKLDGSSRASSLHDTQREAEQAARQMLENSGGGELKTKGLDGRIPAKTRSDGRTHFLRGTLSINVVSAARVWTFKAMAQMAGSSNARVFNFSPNRMAALDS